MSFISFFNSAKDRALAATIKMWFNKTRKRYGTMTSIQIDSTTKTIHLELELNGESTPVHIDIKNYHLSSDSGQTLISLGDISTSREWINQLIGDFLPPEKRVFKVPTAVNALL